MLAGIKFGKVTLNERILALLFCSLAILLAQVSDKTNSIAVMAVSYILLVMIALSCSADCIMGMNLFLLADNSIMDLGGISIQLLLMLIYVVRFIIIRKRWPYTFTFLAGVLISIYSLIYVHLGVGYALQGLKLALMIIYLTEFLSGDFVITKEKYETFLSYAVDGLVVSVAAAIIVNPDMLLSSRIALSAESNWNLLGILASLLFTHSFVMCFNQKGRGRTYVVYSMLTAMCSLISTSRTALLVCMFGTVWTVLFINKKGTLWRKLLILIAVCVFGVLLIQGVIQISYVNKLVDRIINPRRGDISNGRFVLWSRYIEYLLTNRKVLFWGYGRTLIEGITTGTSVASNMAHNIVIEQFTMYGIIGTIIVFLLYNTSIKRIVKRVGTYSICNFKIKYAITIILVFVAGMFSHIITSVLVTMELYFGVVQFIALSE